MMGGRCPLSDRLVETADASLTEAASAEPSYSTLQFSCKGQMARSHMSRSTSMIRPPCRSDICCH